MRIHGVHVQGLRAPKGTSRLSFDPGYNVVFASDAPAALGVTALIRGLLYPATDLGSHELWGDPEAEAPPRAGLAISFSSHAYRLIVDFETPRLVLGRYVPDSKSYERLSTDPAAAEALLRGEGLPNRDEFLALYQCLGTAAVAPRHETATPAPEEALAPQGEPNPERARMLQELEEVEAQWSHREELENRLRELREASEQLAPLEANNQRLLAELERRSVLAEVVDDLEPRLERVRELDAERARERVAIEQSRRELLDERSELRSIPARQDFPLWVGVALVILGWIAGLLTHPLFYICSVVGALSVAAALIVSRTARHRMGSVEACLAALRVRERSVERDFESESAPIRGVMRALGLSTLEELSRDAADYRGVLARAKEVDKEMAELRKTLPEELKSEFGQLEAQLEALSDLPDPAEMRAALESLPEPEPAPPSEPAVNSEEAAPDVAPPNHDADLDALIQTAALLTGRSDFEVQELFAPILPLYLRLLSGRTFVKARRREI
jgi:flagellar motility protein MotE (MotC chaperone)